MWIRAGRIPLVQSLLLILAGVVAEAISLAKSGFHWHGAAFEAVVALGLARVRAGQAARRRKQRLKSASEIFGPNSGAQQFLWASVPFLAAAATAVVVVVVAAVTGLPIGLLALSLGFVEVTGAGAISRWEAAEGKQLLEYPGRPGRSRRTGWVRRPWPA